MDTVPETFKTLQLQVDALAEGTNPIVYFPKNTSMIPKLPEQMRSLLVPKLGWFYYNPKLLTEERIKEFLAKNAMWALLGFVQKKDEAILGEPIAITVRDSNNNEIKTAVVDSRNEDLVSLQSYIFHHFFPNRRVESTTVFHIIAERLAGGANGTGPTLE